MYRLTQNICKPDVQISKFTGLGIHRVSNSRHEKHVKM